MRGVVGVAALLMSMLALFSCSSLGDLGEPLPSSSQEPNAVHSPVPGNTAVLDWESATITLPLDRFGMSLSDVLVVEAAGSLEFARCVLQTDNYPEAAVEEAVRYIGSTPMAHHWRYGWWDADYVARNGYTGIQDDPLALLTDGSSRDQIQDCLEQIWGMGLEALNSEHLTDADSALLGTGTIQAMDRTLSDAQFLALREQLRICVSQLGYTVYSTEPGADWSAVKTDASWSQEQVFQAALAEAECADDMSYTQQVGDIDAGYQLEYIREHEAELVQTKQIADERVAKAASILQDAGVM